MNDFFDSILKKVDRALEGIGNLDFLDFDKPRPDFGKEKTSKSTPTTEAPEWSKGDFRDHLQQLARTGGYSKDLPNSIDLSGLGAILSRLSHQTDGGVEYARITFSRLQDGKIEVGETFERHRLSEISQIVSEQSVLKAPVGVIQTRHEGNYISAREIENLLEHPRFNLTIILAPKVTLMALKTADTPALTDDIRQQVAGWTSEALNSTEVVPAVAMMRFTKKACSAYNLVLYRIIDEGDSKIARRLN